MNRLAKEKSPYLRHASSQRIDWYPWGEEAFERAMRENKPVFLSTGAIWCHWCHVMAKECFENEEIVRTLNDLFISVKLDRDERPDIDKRYQQAVIAMGGGGGWPLSVFLTPDRKPFFGGTYFPPEDSHGRPGFKKVLLAASEFFHSKKDEVSEYTERLAEYLKPAPASPGELRPSLLEKAESAIVAEFDPKHGGFGSSPKFPMPGAMEFLINRHFYEPKDTVAQAAKKTLEAMAKGGFYDQLKGGFHRYSTDEAWIIPHFEKMADDNAWLLKNYIHGYLLFGDEYFRTIAEGIAGFVMDVLSDPEGGFYASQDADVTPDDEGGYFTWTEEDFRRVLNEEECRVMSMHFFREKGAMHHNPAKNVLSVAMEPDEISGKTGISVEKVQKIIDQSRQKLLAERDTRETPLVDRTLYTSLNGLCITSFLTAFRALRDERLRDCALKSLDRVLKQYFTGTDLYHTEGVKAVLDDYIYLMEGLICAYEVTGRETYFHTAHTLMQLCIDKFWDRDSGGFFDTEKEVLGVRLKAIEDIPHPSANSLGIMQLLKFYHMTRKEQYYQYAEKSLKVFSGNAQGMGIHAGHYFCAMDAYFHMVMLTVEAAPETALALTAVNFFNPYKSIYYSGEKGLVQACLISGACLEPVYTPEKLREFLRNPS